MMPITSATKGSSFRCLETYYMQHAGLRRTESTTTLSTSTWELPKWELRSFQSSCTTFSCTLDACIVEQSGTRSSFKSAIAHALSILKHKIPPYCMPVLNFRNWIKSRPKRSRALQRIYLKRPSKSPPLLRSLPIELIALAIGFLDGKCILNVACVSKALCKETYLHENIWKRLCLKKWPSLQIQDIQQLPEAPNYDIIHSYGGSWRRCFQQNHSYEQSTLFTIELNDFPNLRDDRIISETFSILEHDFCLWVLPRGNPNEPRYAGQALSVYLVMTNLEKRETGWSTCAIFTLSVLHSKDPAKNINWHSNLIDNKLCAEIDNWGVHCFESLSMLKDPESGYLHREGKTHTLKIQAHVRIMTITFRIVFESDLHQYHGLGLLSLPNVISLQLSLCSTLQELLDALQPHIPYNRNGPLHQHLRVWCCSQPITPTLPMRPTKLLTTATADRGNSMFGSLLCDGTDIDAYSFCYLYVEDTNNTNRKVAGDRSDRTELQKANLVPARLASGYDMSDNYDNYVFMKALHPTSHKLQFIGKFGWSTMTKMSTMMLCKRAAEILRCSWINLEVYREEAPPRLLSGPIPVSDAQSDILKASDIVIFAVKTTSKDNTLQSVMEELLWSHYEYAAKLLSKENSYPNLRDIEEAMQFFQIPRYCVRNVFHKCDQNARRTLEYIMEGRQLGFACDKCEEIDFLGSRFNCLECSDYDECQACSGDNELANHGCIASTQRGRSTHDQTHTMLEILPLFYNFPSAKYY